MSKRTTSDAEFVAGFLLLVIVLLLLLAWLAVQAGKLVIRTIVVHWHNKALRIAAGVALVATLLALVTGGQLVALDALACVSVLGLVVVTWSVDTYYNAMFKRELTRERLIQDVIGPWW